LTQNYRTYVYSNGRKELQYIVFACYLIIQTAVGTRKTLTWGRTDHFTNIFLLQPMTLPFKLDLDSVKVNQHAKYDLSTVCPKCHNFGLLQLWHTCTDFDEFSATVCKMVRLCYRSFVCMCLSFCLSFCLSVCNVGVLWPNGWMDQHGTWHAGRPLTRPHCIR